MTKRHNILFHLWKLKMWIKGIKVGTLVQTWSDDKNKIIRGCITYFSGCSISETKYQFDLGITWFEPIQGNDSRYYNQGSYTERDLETHKVEIWNRCKKKEQLFRWITKQKYS